MGIFHLAHNSQHCSLGCFYGQEQRLGAFLLLHLVKLSAVSGQNYESVSGQSEYHLRLILGLPSQPHQFRLGSNGSLGAPICQISKPVLELQHPRATLSLQGSVLQSGELLIDQLSHLLRFSPLSDTESLEFSTL